MYSKLMFLLWGANGIQAFVLVFGIVGGLALLISSGIAWGNEYANVTQSKVPEVNKRWLPKFMRRIALILFVVVTGAIIPSRQTLLAWIALRSVDEYNATNQNSALAPERIIGTADQIVETIELALDKARQALGKKE